MVYSLSIGRARDPLIAITIFATIAVLTTGLRIRARKMRNLSLAIDDYLMTSALFCLFLSVAIQYACVIAGGVGRHITDVHPHDVVPVLKLLLPFEVLYATTLCLTKSSIISFYLRIFGTARTFRISAYVSIGVLIAWAISIILEAFLLCRPLAYNWDSTIKGVCGNRSKVYISAGALNVVTDFMVMALPIPHIFGLRLRTKKKLGLVLMFSLGLFITIISIIRLKSLQGIDFTDPTYTFPMGMFWTTLEPCLCIVNGNLSMVRTYLATKFPAVFGSTKGDDTYGISDRGRVRTQASAYGGRVRAHSFEMLGDLCFEKRELKGGMNQERDNLGRTTNVVSVRVEADSDGSQKWLTEGKKNQIIVGRSIEVESLQVKGGSNYRD